MGGLFVLAESGADKLPLAPVDLALAGHPSLTIRLAGTFLQAAEIGGGFGVGF